MQMGQDMLDPLWLLFFSLYVTRSLPLRPPQPQLLHALVRIMTARLLQLRPSELPSHPKLRLALNVIAIETQGCQSCRPYSL